MKKTLFILSCCLPILVIGQDSTGTFKVRKQNNSGSFSSEREISDTSVALITEEMPTFPGGINAMMVFLAKNTAYPDSSKVNGISGTVYVNFTIKTDGSISDVKVLRGVNQELDDEAVRVIQLMPKWNSGMQRGKSVAVSYNIPIKFELK